jgi:WD40 repeat protein
MISFFIQSAVTCLCFAPNSEQIITASKDGSIRVWNINGMLYLLTSDLYDL